MTVAAWSTLPPSAPRGVVVLCHGLTTGADDDGPFLPLRDRLVRRGLGVVRFDARCHGETGGGWRDLSLTGWRDDVVTAIELARDLAVGPLPLLVLSASFSAGPAIQAVLDNAPDCAGMVFWSPVLDYPRTYLSDEFAAGAKVLSTKGDAALPEWAEYEVPWASVPLSRSLVTEMQADQTPCRAARMRCPGVVVHGTADPFVAVAMSRDVSSGAPGLQLRELPLARHGFRGLRPLVRALSVLWLERRARAERSSAT